MGLSKSLYVNGMQCPKLMWLSKHRKGDESVFVPNASLEAIFERGNEVGELACELFAGGERIKWENSTFDEKIAQTSELIAKGTRYIYEATFSFKGALIMVDILEILPSGELVINEVKSSTIKPSKPQLNEAYLNDTAFQYFVLTSLGYNVKNVNLICLNSDYIRGDELDIHQLFYILDLTQNAKEQFNNIKENVEHFEKILEQKDEPKCDIGIQCGKPHECGAKNYCWGQAGALVEGSVFDIALLGGRQKFNRQTLFELFHNNIKTIDEIKNFDEIPSYFLTQIKAHQQKLRIMDKNAIREFLSTLSYPIYHLDFETFQIAIPLWRGTKPYEQIPFQYSLHIDKGDGSTPAHKEFLPNEFCDPRLQLAERLVNDIPKDACILAYNAKFEKGVLKSLASMFPNLAEYLMAIHDNIKDLMLPFDKRYFYDYKQNGGYSIKDIQPILAPSIDEGYKAMKAKGEISNGGEAMQAFPSFKDKSVDEIQELRKQLLAYCGLDTLAMVKVLEGLKELVE